MTQGSGRRWLAVGVGAAIAAVVGAQPGHADPLKLVTGNGYEPFTDESLPKGGLSVRLVNAIYGELNQPVSITFKPWKRGYQETLKGKYAATFPYVGSEKRREDHIFSEPFFTIRSKLMVWKDGGYRASSMADVKGADYCYPLGYSPDGKIAEMTDSGAINRHKPPDMKSCLRLLKKQRVDFVLINNVQGPAKARNVYGSMDPVTFLDIKVGQERHHYMMFPRSQDRSRKLVQQFNKGLAAIRENGTYQNIVSDYVARDSGGV